jgi:hypothetical protein
MSKKRQRAEHWKPEPEEHDFPAAADYLSLLVPELLSASIVEELRAASAVNRKAKDLMRASGLPLLPIDDPYVAKDLKRVAMGELLSPVLLVRGQAGSGLALIVADGYHRICASYHLNEDADIPCRIADLP